MEVLNLETGTVLKILRGKRNMQQKELATKLHYTASHLSKIESNDISISNEMLEKHLSALRARIEDFNYIKEKNTHYNSFLTDYWDSFTPNSPEEVENAYTYFSKNKDKNLDHYFYYMKIKLFFAESYPKIVHPFTQKEMLEIYSYITGSSEFTIFDYQLVGTIFSKLYEHLTLEQLKQILAKMLPVSMDRNITEDATFRSHIRTLLNNAATLFVVLEDHEAAIYLGLFKKYLNNYPHMESNAIYKYLYARMKYQETNNEIYITDIQNNIKYHKYYFIEKTANDIKSELIEMQKEKSDRKPINTEITSFTEI